MIAPDTSVLVASLAVWHPLHDAAHEALRRGPRRLVGHVAFETVSTLGRMPEWARVDSGLVLAGIEHDFPEPWLALTGAGLRTCMRRAIDADLRGGALYDALIAAAATEHGATLLSADLRAQAAYEAMGADVTLIAS